jgi:inhibitor of cysteine peptidase
METWGGVTAVLRPRWWMFVLAVVVVAVAGLVAVKGAQRARYGTVHDEHDTTIGVDRGDRFTLAVPDRGASVGDHWTADIQPSGAVVLERSRLNAGSFVDRLVGPANGGGAGIRYLVFNARRSGKVTITLHNCFQGCGDERTRAASRDVAWTVDVH